MVEPLRPRHGGFLRSFGCGQFIRDFLLGHGPGGSPEIHPEIGAPQAEIFHHYKMALMRATALDRAISHEEKRAKREKRLFDIDRVTELANRYLARMPYKAQGCRYHSFVVYFSNLIRLHWVEATGQEEPSEFQDHYPDGPPKRYYRLTLAGRTAADEAWLNPRLTLYGPKRSK